MTEEIVKLQHQMKHNSEELQDFLRDMGNWAKEIGIKDEQLRKRKAESHSKVFQPLRSVDELKRKVVVEAPDEDDSSSKVEKKTKVNTRIPSYEYDAWAKFDVDKALEEVDVVDHEKQEIEEVMELTDEMKLQKAIVEKDKGNDYFKQGRFSDAVKCYTNGIQCDPRNAVLPANRAMAYLKMKEWSLAEADCTLAISLDSTYVKAYQRRATARKNMLNYGKALADFTKVLELEPNNKQAQAEIEELRFRMKNPPASTTKNKEKKKSSSVKFDENLKGKLSATEPLVPGQVLPIDIPVHKRSSAPLKRIEILEIGDEDEMVSTKEHLSSAIEHESVTRPKIEIIEVTENSLVAASAEEVASIEELPAEDKVEGSKSRGEAKRVELEINEGKKVMITASKPKFKKPSTSVQFTNVWHQLKEMEDQITYLSLLGAADYPRIFKHSMEPSVFSSIIGAMIHFPKITRPLLGLSRIPRISALIMFLEDKERKILDALLERLPTEPCDLTPSEMECIVKCFQA